jgi:hypothetical protein
VLSLVLENKFFLKVSSLLVSNELFFKKVKESSPSNFSVTLPLKELVLYNKKECSLLQIFGDLSTQKNVSYIIKRSVPSSKFSVTLPLRRTCSL